VFVQRKIADTQSPLSDIPDIACSHPIRASLHSNLAEDCQKQASTSHNSCKLYIDMPNEEVPPHETDACAIGSKDSKAYFVSL
jgi:hypothetical protein